MSHVQFLLLHLQHAGDHRVLCVPTPFEFWCGLWLQPTLELDSLARHFQLLGALNVKVFYLGLHR